MNFVTFGVVRSLLSGYELPQGALVAIYIVGIIICIVSAYLLGQLNFAIILSKKLFGVDVREYGSGNGGATNMLRTFGKKAGIVTLLGDMGKAVVACLIGYIVLGRLGAYISGFFCMLGHTFPAKYKFKGGKGVACAAAVILMTDLGNVLHVPVVFLILLACFAAIALGLKYVSLASVMCMLIYPLVLNRIENFILDLTFSFESLGEQDKIVFLNLYREVNISFLIALLMSILVIFMHRENIKRLLRGEESKLDLSKKSKPAFELQAESAEAAPEEETRSEKPDKNTSKKKIKRNKK